MITQIVKEEIVGIPFPCLMKSKNTSLLILATGFAHDEGHVEGTVLVENEYNRLGSNSVWVRHYFEVFNGTVTWQNT